VKLQIRLKKYKNQKNNKNQKNYAALSATGHRNTNEGVLNLKKRKRKTDAK